MKNRKYAFTLAELLVSLSIILALAVLLFGVITKSINRAKSTVCISNLKQIGEAMMLYKNDYGDYPPNTLYWEGLLPYFGFKIPKCPINDDPKNPEYYLHASYKGLAGELLKDDKECYEQRRDMYPIAHDQNHATTLAAYTTGESRFYLFLRENGAVGRISCAQIEKFFSHPELFPCPRASLWSNF